MRGNILPRQGANITRKQWRWAALAGVAAVALLIFLRFRGGGPIFDWAAFAATFYRLDWPWLALASLLAYATYFGRALRWAVFLRPLRPHPGMWNLVKATIIGFTAIVLLGRPGEIVRPYLISVKEQVSLTSQVAAWFLERIFDLLFALFIFGYGLSRLSVSHSHIANPALQWLFQVGGSLVWILSTLCLGLLIFLRHYPELFRTRLLAALGFLDERRLASADKMISSFLQGVESIRSTPAVVLTLVYTALEWILIAACYFCVLTSFNGPVRFSPIDIFIYIGFVAVGSAVQLPGIGGGMQVVSVLVLHEIFGIPLEIATSMSLVVWITTFIILLPAGIPLALHEGLNWNKLKALREDVSL